MIAPVSDTATSPSRMTGTLPIGLCFKTAGLFCSPFSRLRSSILYGRPISSSSQSAM